MKIWQRFGRSSERNNDVMICLGSFWLAIGCVENKCKGEMLLCEEYDDSFGANEEGRIA